jgi:hypothetical protein
MLRVAIKGRGTRAGKIMRSIAGPRFLRQSREAPRVAPIQLSRPLDIERGEIRAKATASRHTKKMTEKNSLHAEPDGAVAVSRVG